MKRGSEYAKRIKQLHQQMTRKFGKPALPEPTDPIQQLIVGILSENSAETKASHLFSRICEQMVDLNELRVTPPMELADMIGTTVPQASEKAERVIRVLNEVRARQDALDLSFLKQRGRREAREFLESLDGVGLYAAASVVVHSLGGHAIPVDYLTIYVLRKADLVEASATPQEVQAFLERNISAADGRAFTILLNRHVAAEGARVSVNRLPELLNLAPPEPPKPRRMSVPRPEPVPVEVEAPLLEEEELSQAHPGKHEVEPDTAPAVRKKTAGKAGGSAVQKHKKPPSPKKTAAKQSKAKTVKSKHVPSARKKKG